MNQATLLGLRVVDATRMLADPLVGTRLGDLGAHVIILSLTPNNRGLAIDLKETQ